MAMSDSDWIRMMDMLRETGGDNSKIDIDATDEGWCALHSAARSVPNGPGRCHQLELILMLMKRGADVNSAANDDGTSPLIAAVAAGNVHAVYHFLKYGFDSKEQAEKVNLEQQDKVP
jgi:ankyrin repeat protein